MPIPLHIGLEHPNLLWIVAVGIITFAAGLGVNLYRSTRDSDSASAIAGDDPSE